MIAFWIAASLLASASAALVIYRASRAAARAAGAAEDPSVALYRRQLAEVDDLAGLGLISPEESRSTRAEAARRLLAAADTAPKPIDASQSQRMAVLAAAVIAPLLALAAYFFIGSPGFPDQPFQRRVEAWRNSDLRNLDPERMVAVLQTLVAQRPGDATALFYLAQAQAQAGDDFSAERNVQKALKLKPDNADLWALDGRLAATDAPGDVLPDEARRAFRTALKFNPKALEPRYFLARDLIASGHVDEGLAGWKALRADIPPDDSRGVGMDQEIALVTRLRALPPGERTEGPQGQAAAEQAQAGDQKAFISAMVARLAAKLQASPDDPAGWARLVRSYAVLGDTTQRDAALAQARTLFKTRPNDLAQVEAAAR